MKETIGIHHDVISGGVLFAVSALYYLGTLSLPAGKGEPGPAFFPVLLASALGVLGILIFFQGLKKGAQPQATFGKPALAMVVTALYVASFPVLGFALSTWLYTLVITVMFRRDRWLEPVVVPILTTVLIYLLFRVGLGVRLPSGLIGWP